MAIDVKDLKTVDAFPLKKRGRRPTGLAKTAAQRMAEKRERDRALINRARTAHDYAELSTPALLIALGDAVSQGIPKVAKLISEILIERAKQAASQ